MRKPFTKAQALAAGKTIEQLRWAEGTGAVQRVCRGAYIRGGEPPTPLEEALALAVVTGGIASHSLAGVLYELDNITLVDPYVTVNSSASAGRPGVRKRKVAAERVTVVGDYRCTDGTQTMLDLATVVDDLVWEQALESALRRRLTSIPEIEAELPRLSRERATGIKRIKRVLQLRPDGAPHTDSLLETLMVQAIRSEPRLPTPERQREIRNRYDEFVARVDLAYPEHGVFVELDGQQHKDQPVYDASRQTAVVAATGWRPARFTWDEVNYLPRPTLRRLVDILGV